MKSRGVLLSVRKWVDRRFPSRESICLLFALVLYRKEMWRASFGSRMCCMIVFARVGIQGYFPSWNRRRTHYFLSVIGWSPLAANSIFWMHFNFGNLSVCWALWYIFYVGMLYVPNFKLSSFFTLSITFIEARSQGPPLRVNRKSLGTQNFNSSYWPHASAWKEEKKAEVRRALISYEIWTYAWQVIKEPK